MIGFLKLYFGVCVYFIILNIAECQVTVTNLDGAGIFLCGYTTRLECAIPGYGGEMSWNLDGTLIAQCAFGSCDPLGALPSGDNFIGDEANRMFYLNISITHADNETTYVCDDTSNQDQTTVNIQVPPSESAFTMNITEGDTSIMVEAGCFYPSGVGKMDVYCVSGGTVKLLDAAITMTSTTTGCTGDCAGSNIYTATGSISLNGSNTGGNSRYRFKVYHEDFKQYAITKDSAAVYDCEKHSTSPPTSTSTSPITTPPPGPDCGETCIIIIVVVVVGVVIFIIIIIVCVRKRNTNEATKEHAENNDKHNQNNIQLGEPVHVA